MLLLAMSCLQARTQDAAFSALVAHGPDGVQLTPGNLPSPGFRERVGRHRGVVRLHHGFCFDRYRRPVFTAHGEPIAVERDRSIHPPRTAGAAIGASDAAGSGPVVDARAWLPRAAAHDLLLETMYPGHVLGTGAELDLAMDLGLRLAVDVSHLHIQRTAGVLPLATLRRLHDYERIDELHVSHNDGRADRHAPVAADTPGLAWVRERAAAAVPVVYEVRWHRLGDDERRRQMELMRTILGGTCAGPACARTVAFDAAST